MINTLILELSNHKLSSAIKEKIIELGVKRDEYVTEGFKIKPLSSMWHKHEWVIFLTIAWTITFYQNIVS